ncbi:PHP domain-containing protein [Candidatus Omnitrophota bacterium]
MQKLADLHVHTYLSDGTFSPEEVVEYSKSRGLNAVAITDHDSCGAITPAVKRGKDLGLEVIPGVELSVELDEEEMHMLGYFIDWQNTSFIKKLEDMTRIRKERAKEILGKLKKHGIDISEEELFELSGPGSVGRSHIANLLARKGFVNSISQAFSKYIGNNGPCYVKKFKLSPKEGIDIIKGIGGISVLAHPKTININNRPTEEILKALLKDGIQGIEVYYPEHTPQDEENFKKLAEKYDLLMTGGSDCHGSSKKGPLIGKVKVPYELVEKMKESLHLSQ